MRKKVAADAASLPFSAALAAAEFRNMHWVDEMEIMDAIFDD